MSIEFGDSSKEKQGKKVSSHYDISGNKIKRILPFCERCGPGYFMAKHSDRFSCGHCGYTKYAKKNN